MAFAKDSLNGRPAQIMDLCFEINVLTSYVAHITFDGKNDLFVVKLSKDDTVLFSKKIDKIKDKSPAYVEKELKNIAELLIKYKTEV